MTGSTTAPVETGAIVSSEQDAQVHVVTVTHNSGSTIDEYFAGIARCVGQIAVVTVVDNESTDDTVVRVRAAADAAAVPVEIVLNTNDGFAGGYAAADGSVAARGLPVLCLNPDVSLSEGAVTSMLEVLTEFPDAAIVTVPLVERDGTPDSASRRRLPTLGASMVYSLLGRLTPGPLRYNRRSQDEAPNRRSTSGFDISELEATTGAAMLIAPDFRSLESGIFDRDYWMYGEDLQLCVDARAAGRHVLMAEVLPSTHIKGVSSGRPRSRRSNRAFHDAMATYARKNLVSSPVVMAGIKAGVEAHFALTEALALPTRVRRRRSAAKA